MLEVFFHETENWVAVGFLLFIGLLAYLGAHRRIADSLDQRQARIKAELDEARRLKEEAQALLAEFERKGREAEGEAAAIIAGASAEAERLAVEAKARMEDFVARRTRMAEAKIGEAEAQALADVRSAAADAAVAAAEKILSNAAKGKIADDLLAQGIEDVRKKFN
jgi:F-type H+-transporting ATPase subunit b